MCDTKQVLTQSWDVSNGNVNVSNENTIVVTQDLCAKVIILECFLLNKIWQQNNAYQTFVWTQ